MGHIQKEKRPQKPSEIRFVDPTEDVIQSINEALDDPVYNELAVEGVANLMSSLGGHVNTIAKHPTAAARLLKSGNPTETLTLRQGPFDPEAGIFDRTEGSSR